MRFEHMKARPEREDKALAPPASAHVRGLTREIGRQLVVEGENDRLFAREVPIKQPDADLSLFGNLPKSRGLVSAPRNQADRDAVQAVSRLSALRRLSGRAAPF